MYFRVFSAPNFFNYIEVSQKINLEQLLLDVVPQLYKASTLAVIFHELRARSFVELKPDHDLLLSLVFLFFLVNPF